VSRVIITERAAQGLERCRQFLAEKNFHAMKRAGLAIEHTFMVLETDPEMSRPIDELPELRELLVPFGDSGYVTLYRYDSIQDTVYILAFRHQKEAGY